MLSALDALLVLAFVAAAVTLGLRARARASRNLEEYFLAGRSLPGWQAGASMAATQFAADTPLLVTGLIATAGIFALWRLWIYAVAFLLLGFVLAPLWRRARVVTDAELAELRYGERPAAWLRGIKAVYFGTVFNCVVLGMVLWAAKELAEPFLLWNEWLPAPLFEPIRAVVEALGISFARDLPSGEPIAVRSTNNVLSLLAIVGVTTLYSATGGLRSVVQTDVLQLALMLGGTAAYAAFVVAAVGGLDALPEAVRQSLAAAAPRAGPSAEQILAFTPSRAYELGPALLGVFFLQWLVQMNADGTGYLAQRAMACRTDDDARTAAIVFTVLQVVVRSLIWLPIGLGLLVLYPPDPGLAGPALAADREVTFVRGIAELLPSGVLGLLLTAMLAALASTIDTHLNWGASYWTNDLYRRFLCEGWLGRTPSDRSLVRVARLSNVAILLIALGVMTQLSSIQHAWRLSLVLGAGMGVPLVLRWLWWRRDAWGELAAIVTTAVLAPVLLLAVESDAVQLLVVALVSTVSAVGVSIATGGESPERLRAFYERVRPPGFWSAVAPSPEAARAGVRRLVGGLAATALGSLACFCTLVGAGTWLVGGSLPTWWPAGAASWVGANLVLAFVLAPAAWRVATRNAG